MRKPNRPGIDEQRARIRAHIDQVRKVTPGQRRLKDIAEEKMMAKVDEKRRARFKAHDEKHGKTMKADRDRDARAAERAGQQAQTDNDALEAVNEGARQQAETDRKAAHESGKPMTDEAFRAHRDGLIDKAQKAHFKGRKAANHGE